MRCYRCKTDQPLEEMVFVNNRPSHTCLACNRKRVATWKKKNPEKVVRRTVRYGQRYPEKRRAVDHIRRAVKNGTICYPLTCSECDASGKIHAHHEDYSKPHEVIFLCPKCHSKKHHKRKSE